MGRKDQPLKSNCYYCAQCTIPCKGFHWEVIISDQMKAVNLERKKMEAVRKHKPIRKSMNRSSQIYATKVEFKHNGHSVAC